MNSLLETLQSRASIPAHQLTEPAPDDKQLQQIIRCGLSAPDHARLRPWRFIIIRGSARHALADVMVQTARRNSPDISVEKLDAIREKPLRSPLILVIVATITPGHVKTPEVEQWLSAGAATQLIQLGATALGFGSIWLTGTNAYAPEVKRALGLEGKDHIAGFLYMGTPKKNAPSRQRPDVSEHMSEWNGKR
jgi:nitroreductase